MTQQHADRREVDLPPMPDPEAGPEERARAIEARMIARNGPPPLAEYRRAFDACGLEWPGDDEFRRLHPAADSAA